jgi:hypothetical protein
MTISYTPVLVLAGPVDAAMPAVASVEQAVGTAAAGPGALAGPSWVDQRELVLPPAATAATTLAEPATLAAAPGAVGGGGGDAGLPTPPDLAGLALLLGALMVLAGWRRARR